MSKDPKAKAAIQRVQVAWKQRDADFKDVIDGAARAENKLERQLANHRASTESLKAAALAKLQDLVVRLENSEAEATVLSSKLKSRELQLDQELKDKELLVKQMDGYEQKVSALESKLDGKPAV